MSKERELLKRCFEYIYPSFESNLLCDEIEELLAQPEQEPEQEPVAWMCNLLGDVVTYKPNVNNGYTPLYAASSKREPVISQDLINDIEYLITAFEQGADADDYWRPISGLRDDLKNLKHGITGGKE